MKSFRLTTCILFLVSIMQLSTVLPVLLKIEADSNIIFDDVFFLLLGARVIMACRNVEKAKEAQLDVIKESGSSNVVVRKLDLASMKSIREFVEELKKEEKSLDVLVNNAGKNR